MAKASRHRVLTLLLATLSISLMSTSAFGQRRVSEEALLFERLKDGVFTILSEYGEGTGFLADASGLVVTNAHVLAGSERVRVKTDPTVKVEAIVIEVDKARDIALLRIHVNHCEGRPVLQLARNDEEAPILGERVIAIGSPLSHERVLTAGIISQIEEGVIYSDVNSNPGSSGGPLIAMNGVVVGINTFMEAAESGHGLSGAIALDDAIDMLDRALEDLGSLPVPSDRLLPTIPQDSFPLQGLEAAVLDEHWSENDYVVEPADSRDAKKKPGILSRPKSSLDVASDYTVALATPPALYRVRKSPELDLASRDESGDYDPVVDLTEWSTSANPNPPVVYVIVIPVASEFSQGLTAQSRYEYRGDVGGMRLIVDGNPVEELQSRLIWDPLRVRRVGPGFVTETTEDLARSGVLVFRPEVFLPRDDAWPTVNVEVEDGRSGRDIKIVTIPQRILERIALDFRPWFRELRDRNQELLVNREATP
jgi:hypothetical protein